MWMEQFQLHQMASEIFKSGLILVKILKITGEFILNLNFFSAVSGSVGFSILKRWEMYHTARSVHVNTSTLSNMSLVR
jgi:hypothetical protein